MFQTQADSISKWGWLNEEGRSYSFTSMNLFATFLQPKPCQDLPNVAFTTLALPTLLPNFSPRRSEAFTKPRPRKKGPRIIRTPIALLPLTDRRANFHRPHWRLGPFRTTLERLHPITRGPEPSQPSQRPRSRRIPLPHRHSSIISTTPRARHINCPPICQPWTARNLQHDEPFREALIRSGHPAKSDIAWYKSCLAHRERG